MISWVSVPGVRCNIYVDDTAIYFFGTTTDTIRKELFTIHSTGFKVTR